jgi:hypothetical protein
MKAPTYPACIHVGLPSKIMSRNMKKLSKELFELLTTDTNLETSSKNKLRLKSEDEESIRSFQEGFIKKSKVITKEPTSTFIINNVRVCLTSYLEEKYILITEIHPDDEFDIKGLNDHEIHIEEIYGGTLLLFNNLLKINLKKGKSEQERIENLLYQQEDVDYVGHSVEDILPYLEDFCVFKISKDSTFIDMKDVEIAYYILINYSNKFVHLQIPDETLNEYKKHIRETYNQFKENIFLSLTSTHFKHSFIELYRCIEMLYSLPKAIKLKQSIGFKKTAYELSKLCFKDLTWKNPERESIKAIFNEIDSEIILQNTDLMNLMGLQPENEMIKNIDKAAEYIYKLRIQLVHQIDISSEMVISKNEWQILLLFLLKVIESAYIKFKSELPIY